MTIPTFSCPACHAVLRVRDRSWVGREIDCPECKTRLAMLGFSTQGWDVRLAADLQVKTPAVTITPAVVLAPLAGSQRSLSRGLGWFGDRPIIVAWLSALLVAGVAVAVVVLQSRPAAVTVVPDIVAPPDLEIAPEPDEPVVTEVTEPPAADRLRRLHARVTNYVDQIGAYPVATRKTDNRPPQAGFSWLAQLELQQSPNTPAPHPSTEWSDPVNDAFVRRQIPDFLNSDVSEVVGSDRRPVTHFVGMTGVGPDAAELPLVDPRAGMFGYNRRVTQDDLVDGAANTWMVAGVSQQLGSWAAAGNSTLRGLTQEPYVNGPDGLGTGQADSMLILLADGSVKTVSRNIEPGLLRRMAAIGDGLPLDLSVPGEPGTQKRLTHNLRLPIAYAEDPESPPANALNPSRQVIRPVKVFDLQAALAQPLQQFEQAQPVPARELVFLLEELVGAPIRGVTDPDIAPHLDKPLTLSLTDVTVGDVLVHVLREAGLRYETEPEGVRLRIANPIDSAGSR